jgi:hypothetical protein
MREEAKCPLMPLIAGPMNGCKTLYQQEKKENGRNILYLCVADPQGRVKKIRNSQKSNLREMRKELLLPKQ